MNYLLKGETITFLGCLEALGKFTTMKRSLFLHSCPHINSGQGRALILILLEEPGFHCGCKASDEGVQTNLRDRRRGLLRSQSSNGGYQWQHRVTQSFTYGAGELADAHIKVQDLPHQIDCIVSFFLNQRVKELLVTRSMHGVATCGKVGTTAPFCSQMMEWGFRNWPLPR